MKAGRKYGIVRCIGIIAAVVWPSACDLSVVTIEQPEPLVVAELILQAGALSQHAWLHRSGPGPDRTVPGAKVRVFAAGDTLEFVEVRSGCIEMPGETTQDGTCYRLALESSARKIKPGNTYELEIVLQNGGRLSGTTTVPEASRITTPHRECRIEPNSNFDIVWSRSSTAWIYAAEVELTGIRPPLAAMGIDVPRDPLQLFGLSVTRDDTTIVLPKEFGLFNRFDPDLTEALVVLQNGLPPGVVALTRIAPADRNYVNWVRGGNFNPSGTVRIPSVFGEGTGVFASMVPHSVRIHSGDRRYPLCAAI